jgi:hypothetical protein
MFMRLVLVTDKPKDLLVPNLVMAEQMWVPPKGTDLKRTAHGFL